MAATEHHRRPRPLGGIGNPFDDDSDGGVDVRLPSELERSPGRELVRRILFGMSLLAIVAGLAYIERDGYNDTSDGKVSALDAIYYATVSVTTTGYGDVVPVSDSARLVTTIVVTPMRIAFLLLLVGTSVELIAAATRRRYRRIAWRKRVQRHVVILGFGVKGQTALRSLAEKGTPPDQVVVVDGDSVRADAAVRLGCVAVIGDMTSNEVLVQAGVARAEAVIVGPSRDDTAVLAILSCRSLNPTTHIVAAARELENADLLRQSGADIVLTSAGSVGRMLGMASSAPYAAALIEDLLETGRGVDVEEHEVTDSGRLADRPWANELAIAVYRDGKPIARVPNGDQELVAGDRVVTLVRAKEPDSR